ncbi:MAG: hypothetical protein HYX47_10395 [Burkholderiales bacterium]|nr:hypothetical protein [Burkholderiales bacterium]
MNAAPLQDTPEVSEEHAKGVQALATLLQGYCATSEQPPAVVLDALLNVYMHTAYQHGRALECANVMVQIAGQVILQSALANQAAGLDPFASPTRH